MTNATVLVLGVTGMLGSTAYRILADDPDLNVHGTARGATARQHFAPRHRPNIALGVDVENPDALADVFARVKPDIVLNCVGVVKQLAAAKDPLVTVPINTLLPHRLARFCALASARLIHVSTDCVFSGTKGRYTEADPTDATDLYGRSKALGEVDYPHAITLRTSIIGRELGSRNGLVEWFLGETSATVRGFTKAIFSGFTTDELTRVVRLVMGRGDLHGIYHVGSAPISKYDLLHILRETYGREIGIDADADLVVDRSLDSARFRSATGYEAPDWPSQIAAMKALGTIGANE